MQRLVEHMPVLFPASPVGLGKICTRRRTCSRCPDAGKELFDLVPDLGGQAVAEVLAWAGSSMTVARATLVGPVRAFAVIPWLLRKLN